MSGTTYKLIGDKIFGGYHMERITWDQFFMAQSHLLALRSTCTRLMVGATIVRDKRIIAGGYNGNQGIYRTSGMFNETYPQTVYMTDSTKKYHQINLVYDHHSKAGWGDYWNDLNTLLAIPVDDAATLSGVLAVIDALVAPVGMRPLAAETNEAVDA